MSQLLIQLNNFIKRVESAKVILTDEDKNLIGTIAKMLKPSVITKAISPWDILRKILGTNPQLYIMVTKESVLATDNHRFGMMDNDFGLEPGLYNINMEPVPHQGAIELDGYKEMANKEFKNKLQVTESECTIVNHPTEDGQNVIQYIDVVGVLKFNVNHFNQFVNAEPEFEIHFDDEKVASPCRIVNPKFPELILNIMNIVL